MFESSGIEVTDLEVNLPPEKFIEVVKETRVSTSSLVPA